jgi:hypothetical protein
MIDAAAELCRFYLAMALGFASLAKFAAFSGFVENLRSWDITDIRLRRAVAVCLCLMEGGLAILLAANRWTDTVAWLTAALIAAMSAGVAVALASGSGATCQCFGRSPDPVSGVVLARNLAMLAAGVILGLAPKAASFGAGEAAVLMLTALALAQTTVRAPDIGAVLAPRPHREPAR